MHNFFPLKELILIHVIICIIIMVTLFNDTFDIKTIIQYVNGKRNTLYSINL